MQFCFEEKASIFQFEKTYEIANKEQGNNDKYLINKWVCQKKYMIILTYKKHAKWMLNQTKNAKGKTILKPEKFTLFCFFTLKN